jgi:hypothetical protein
MIDVLLRNEIKRKYGRSYNLSTLRDDFNSVVGTQQDQVSKETMRKWITGISMPRTQRINDIERWLDVEIKITATQKNLINKQLNNVTLEIELNQLKNKLESLVAKVNEIKNLIT